MRKKIKKYIGNVVNGFLFIFALLIAYSLLGCLQKTNAKYYPVYKNVNIPVKCQVEIPNMPIFTGNTIEDNINILKYAEKLKHSLQACIN